MPANNYEVDEAFRVLARHGIHHIPLNSSDAKLIQLRTLLNKFCGTQHSAEITISDRGDGCSVHLCYSWAGEARRFGWIFGDLDIAIRVLNLKIAELVEEKPFDHIARLSHEDIKQQMIRATYGCYVIDDAEEKERVMVRRRQTIEYSFQHCRDRAAERYGHTLTREQYDQMTSRAENDTTRLLSSRSGIEIRAFYFEEWDCLVYANYDFVLKRITTLLPPENFEK